MNKIQRTQRKGQPHTTWTPATAISMKRSQTRHCTHNTKAQKKRKHTRRRDYNPYYIKKLHTVYLKLYKPKL